jgi:hypothetical protein
MYNVISNFIVGFFTLLAALSTVWLKDYLENRKLFKSTIKQKAIEAYALTNRVMYSLTMKQTICNYLMSDKEFSLVEHMKTYPDTEIEVSSELLGELEILIIEHFYDLEPQFQDVNTCIINYSAFLSKIICNVHKPELTINNSDFESAKDKFTDDIVKTTSVLRDKLNAGYINKEFTK